MRLLRYLYGLFLGIAYCLACHSWLGHVLYYHGEHSTFRFGSAYMSERVADAGVAAWLGDFVTSMMASPVIGSLIVAVICAAVYYLSDLLWRALTRRPSLLAVPVGLSIASFAYIASIDRQPGAVVMLDLALAVALLVATLVNIAVRRERSVRPWPRLGRAQEWIWIAAALIWSGAGYWYLLSHINRSERTMLLTEKALRAGDYAQVISRADGYLGSGHSNKLMLLFRNYALARRGELAEHLMDYPQTFGADGLSLPWRSDVRESEYGSLVYEAVGHINEAHRWESEALVAWGPTARRLDDLASYNIAMGRPAVARKYIRLLGRMPFRGHRAHELMDEATDSSTLANLRYPLRDQGQSPAHFANISNIVPELEAICAVDSTNAMARQYLLCSLLLRNEVTRFAELLPLYRPEGSLPRLYEEALVIASLAPGADSIAVSEDMRKRFESYAAMTVSGNPEQLRREYGRTYWYYINYLSPYGHKAR